MNKRDILLENLSARKKQIIFYQINIENYKRAMEKSKNDPDLAEFFRKLSELLGTEIIECKKEQIMVDVLEDQLKEMGE